MVATLATQRFYHKSHEGNLWHAYREDSNAALCGQSQISYNHDSIADTLPEGAELHEACAAALRGDEPAPAVTSTPKPAAKAKSTSKTKAKS